MVWFDGVAVLDDRSHAAVIGVTYGLTGHVVGLHVELDAGFAFEVRRPLIARGPRPVLRGDVFDARAVDEHERSFDLLSDGAVVGNLRLGQRVVVDGERAREPRAFGLLSAAA